MREATLFDNLYRLLLLDSFRDRFSRFDKVPTVLVLEIAEEAVRAPEQTPHALRRDRFPRSARSATASRSALLNDACGP